MGLKSRLPEITDRIVLRVPEALALGAELIVESAKERCPVVTGALRDSIHEQREASGRYYANRRVYAGDDKVFYGNMVEHGHAIAGGGQVAPHPFLVPAVEDNRDRIDALVSSAIRRASE